MQGQILVTILKGSFYPVLLVRVRMILSFHYNCIFFIDLLIGAFHISGRHLLGVGVGFNLKIGYWYWLQIIFWHSFHCCSATKSCLTLWDLRDCSRARLPCPSPSPRICLNSCPLSQWCHPTFSSSVVPFSCPQSFPVSGSIPMCSKAFLSYMTSFNPHNNPARQVWFSFYRWGNWGSKG